MSVRNDADIIIRESIKAVLPDSAVKAALEGKDFGGGRLYAVAAGKAACQMAKAASEVLGERIADGVVCTKYGHMKEGVPGMRCFEGGHPVPDENSFAATEAAIELVTGLGPEDTVLFLLSGGGSALFEKPLIPAKELQDITNQLLGCGADIVEMNTVRKRLSAVKGGRFAKICEPTGMYCIVLSDIIGDPLDMIASGPAYPDGSTCADAIAVAEKYSLNLSADASALLRRETPKELCNVETVVTGSVKNLCLAAKKACESLGYETMILTDELTCEAREAGSFLGSIARSRQDTDRSLAFIAGGETVVHVTGAGLGGRNQEIALAAADKIAGLDRTAVFSVGSDGTDGPTDAAGGYCDGDTKRILAGQGLSIHEILRENDAYSALKACGGLIMTGPTGTNVNDVSVVLIHR